MPFWTDSDVEEAREEATESQQDEDPSTGLLDPDEVSSQVPDEDGGESGPNDSMQSEPSSTDDITQKESDRQQSLPPGSDEYGEIPDASDTAGSSGDEPDSASGGGGGGSSSGGGGGGGSSGGSRGSSGTSRDGGGGTDTRTDEDDVNTDRSERSDQDVPGQPRQQDGQQSVQDIKRRFPSRSLQLAALQTQRGIDQDRAEQLLDESPDPEPRQPQGPQEGLERGGTVTTVGGSVYEAFYNADSEEVNAPDTADERLQFTQDEQQELADALNQQEERLRERHDQGQIGEDEFQERLEDIEQARADVVRSSRDIEQFQQDIDDRNGTLSIEDGSFVFTTEEGGGDGRQTDDGESGYEPTFRDRLSAGSPIDLDEDRGVVDQGVDVIEDVGRDVLGTLAANPASFGNIIAAPTRTLYEILPDTASEQRRTGRDVAEFGTELFITGGEISAEVGEIMQEGGSERFVTRRSSAATGILDEGDTVTPGNLAPTDFIGQLLTGAELAEQSAPFINEAVEAAGGPKILPESESVVEDTVTAATEGLGTLGTQGPGVFIAGTGGLSVMAANAQEDPVETGQNFVEGVPAFVGLTAGQAAEDPLRFATQEVFEEAPEAVLYSLVLGPAGTVLGSLPTAEIEPEPEPGARSPGRSGDSGGFPVDQTRIRIDEEGNVFRNLEQEPVGQFQGLTGRMAQARATRSTMRLRGMDADRAADEAAASVDAEDVEVETPEDGETGGPEDIDANEAIEDTLLDSVLEATESEAETDTDADQESPEDIINRGLEEGRDLDEINQELEEEQGVRAQRDQETGQILFQEVEEEQEQMDFDIQEEAEVEEVDVMEELRSDQEQEQDAATEVEEQDAAEVQDLEQELEQELDQEQMQIQEEAQVEQVMVEQEPVQDQDEMLEPDLDIEQEIDQQQGPETEQEQIPEPVLDVTPEEETTPDQPITPEPQMTELEIEPEPESPPELDRPPRIPDFNFEDESESSAEEEDEAEGLTTQFAPSLEAVVFDIRGEAQDEDSLTGLELRPLPELNGEDKM